MTFIWRFYWIIKRNLHLAKMNNLPKHHGAGHHAAASVASAKGRPWFRNKVPFDKHSSVSLDKHSSVSRVRDEAFSALVSSIAAFDTVSLLEYGAKSDVETELSSTSTFGVRAFCLYSQSNYLRKHIFKVFICCSLCSVLYSFQFWDSLHFLLYFGLPSFNKNLLQL